MQGWMGGQEIQGDKDEARGETARRRKAGRSTTSPRFLAFPYKRGNAARKGRAQFSSGKG
eukprot:853475-Pyramimonas_sp.AAC.1